MSSVKRILIWTFILILLILTLIIYILITFDHVLLWPGIALIVFLFIGGGVKWMGRVKPDGRVALRFDRECRNFSYESAEEKLVFSAAEAKFSKIEQGNVHFTVRGKDLTFPARVTAAGNVRTMLHLKGGGEFLFLDLLSIVTKIEMSLLTGFKNEKLEVRALNFYTGEPLPYNRIF